jgi:hypothetical protein
MKILKSNKVVKVKIDNLKSLASKAKDSGKSERTKELEEEALNQPYPESFNKEEFEKLRSFSAREKFCNANLVRIASGSGRVAYKINNNKVLKLAKNVKGVAQNEEEGAGWIQNYYEDCVTKLFDCDDDFLWVEMELADKVHAAKFQQLTGVKFNDYAQYISNLIMEEKGERGYYNLENKEELKENEFISDIVGFAKETGRLNSDIARINSYGVVKRDGHEMVVLVDYGATDAVIKQHYQLKEEETFENAYKKVYLGGKLTELKRRVKNFKVFIPKEGMGIKDGDEIGVSCFVDKDIALNHSKQHNSKHIMPLYISPEAKIFTMDSQGDGLRLKLSPEEIVMLAHDGYDAIMDTNNRLNTEVIILKSDKVFTELELKKN